MFKIAVFLVTTLALAQQSYGLSKCYEGAQRNGQSTLRETACSTDCVTITSEAGGMKHAEMSCDGNNSAGTLRCSSQKDKCAKVNLPGTPGVDTTLCCCSSDLCNGVGVTGLSGAIAMALVAAIFWGQN